MLGGSETGQVELGKRAMAFPFECEMGRTIMSSWPGFEITWVACDGHGQPRRSMQNAGTMGKAGQGSTHHFWRVDNTRKDRENEWPGMRNARKVWVSRWGFKIGRRAGVNDNTGWWSRWAGLRSWTVSRRAVLSLSCPLNTSSQLSIHGKLLL